MTPRSLILGSLALLSGVVQLLDGIRPAFAQESESTAVTRPNATAREGDRTEKRSEEASTTGLGLAPSAIQAGYYLLGPAPSGRGFTRSFNKGWAFSFHGLLTAAATAGISKLRDPRPELEQSSLQLRTPALPGGGPFNSFEAVNHAGGNWSQLNFRYGSPFVAVEISLGGFNFTGGGFNGPDAAGNPQAQLGFNYGWLTLTEPDLIPRTNIVWELGVVPSRYGAHHRWDIGRYGMLLFGDLRVVGEKIGTDTVIADGVRLLLEHGIGGMLRTRDEESDTLVHHAHAGVLLKGKLLLGAHFVAAYARDANRGTQPIGVRDASIVLTGVEARFSGDNFGDAYLGYAQMEARRASNLGYALLVMRSEPSTLAANYFGGTEGTGSLQVVSFQYTVGWAGLRAYPERPAPGSPDLTVSVFAMGALVHSPEPDVGEIRYDGVLKLKYGSEIIWTPRSVFGLSGRFDRVMADTKDPTRAYTVVSPRLFLRTEVLSREQIVLTYSHYSYGSAVTIPYNIPGIPDEHVINLSAFMWW